MTRPTATDEMRPLPVTLIVAATASNAIGRASSLPWRLPKEMAYFARVTKEIEQPIQGISTKNAVIMGRKSWQGIPTKFRPLVDRYNVVVSRQTDFDLGGAAQTSLVNSFEQACTLLSQRLTKTGAAQHLHKTFLIGGAQLYNQVLSRPDSSEYSLERILLTRVKTDFEGCDAFLDDFERDTQWQRSSHTELEQWVGFEVPKGDQVEKDRIGGTEVTYEFQMWTRR
ncbi:hypothetical protein OIO90_003361 [Microbotryomycetes sp. JL221]|nr:hypothetical protein OIO90_003361 [Microbotryomycetes sp. JL221]